MGVADERRQPRFDHAGYTFSSIDMTLCFVPLNDELSIKADSYEQFGSATRFGMIHTSKQFQWMPLSHVTIILFYCSYWFGEVAATSMSQTSLNSTIVLCQPIVVADEARDLPLIFVTRCTSAWSNVCDILQEPLSLSGVSLLWSYCRLFSVLHSAYSEVCASVVDSRPYVIVSELVAVVSWVAATRKRFLCLRPMRSQVCDVVLKRRWAEVSQASARETSTFSFHAKNFPFLVSCSHRMRPLLFSSSRLFECTVDLAESRL